MQSRVEFVRPIEWRDAAIEDVIAVVGDERPVAFHAQYRFATEARQNAPYLKRVGDSIIRVRPEMKGTPQLNTPATEDEIRDGVFFKDEAAYLASRAA